MGTHYIPPKGERQIRIEQAESRIRESLRPFFRGKKKLEEATGLVLEALKPSLSLPKEPTKGSTIMTEKASMERPDKGQFFGKPHHL
jgi:hypothetical protein